MPEEIDQGVLVVDKPAEWTSHDVVAKLRGLLGIRKAGHTGTLDPMATGVLVVCFGKATKIIPYLQDDQKEYLAEIYFGVSTDTLDAEGEVVRRCQVPQVASSALKELCERFVGELEQIPPMFSAVKVGGRRLYSLARSGQTVERAPRKVKVFKLEVVDQALPRLKVRVACSRGTYVRSLARDIGEALGCGAHLAALRRVRSGRFRIEDAHSLEGIAEASEAGRLSALVFPPHEVLDHYPAYQLAAEDARRFRSGVPIAPGPRPGSVGIVRVFDERRAFCGLGSVEDSGVIRPVSVLL